MLKYPIISIIGKQVECYNEHTYMVCPKHYIDVLNKTEEYILDRSGQYYKRGKVSLLKPINIFWGFDLKYGFGVYRVNKEVALLKELSDTELGDLLNILYDKRKSEMLSMGIDVYRLKGQIDVATKQKEKLDWIFKLADPRLLLG